MKLPLLYVLLGYLLAGQPNSLRQVKEATVSFQIRNAEFAVQGAFSGLEVNVWFDPVHPELAPIRASVLASSIHTGITLRDKHLQNPDYFDAARFPVIMLESKAIRKTGAGQYEGLFTLTMKGTARDVKLPFTVSAANALRGTLHVNRLDFDIGKKSLVLADEVTVDIAVQLARGS
ncbi:MAG: YceI family protein [Cytophagaceae bacterium]|nr:MAG: YceI family protein [Cytophagaceae bacterium]